MSEAYLLTVPIVITHKNNMPSIELRRNTTDLKVLKTILSCAFHERPVVILPVFTDKIKSLASLQEKGVLHYDKEKKEYIFNV